MFAGRSTIWVLAFSLFLLTGRPAEGQSGKELRCRGRGGAFTVDRIDAGTVSMRFTASPRAAGADGAGLEPGTCSFVDRVIESAEPLQVRFAANSAQLTSLTQELDDPYAYWCFFVAERPKAFFMAAEQRSCICGESVASTAPQNAGAKAGGTAGKPDSAAQQALNRFLQTQPPAVNSAKSSQAGQAGQAGQPAQSGQSGGGIGGVLGAAGAIVGTAGKVATAASDVANAVSGAETRVGAAAGTAAAKGIASAIAGKGATVGTGASGGAGATGGPSAGAANSAGNANNAAGEKAADPGKNPPDEKTANDAKAPEVDPRPPVITEVSTVPSARDLAFAFKSFANITPHVEVATVPPVQGPDKRWSFPNFRPANKIEQTFLGTGPTIPLSSGIVKLIAGGNKTLGRYTANLMGALDPGIVYYYIISVRLNDDPASEIRQMKGIIHSPGSNKYEVRYRGLYSDSTGGTRSRDIYAIVSTSFVFATGDPAILSTVPSALVPGVRGTEARADSGKRVYNGAPADLLMTVTLMERVGGDPNKVKAAVHESFLNAVGRLLVSPTKPAGAVQLVTNSIKDAMIGGDSVIATSSRLVTAAEMKAMANNEAPKPTERGIAYDFFTEHAGPGGAYRVYFDVVSR